MHFLHLNLCNLRLANITSRRQKRRRTEVTILVRRGLLSACLGAAFGTCESCPLQKGENTHLQWPVQLVGAIFYSIL